MMNNLKLYILILISCSSCGQETTKETTMNIPNKTIQDFLDLYKTVTHYEVETRHWVKVTVANCNFEILINDKKMHFYHDIMYGGVINATYAPINYSIAKGGEQTLKIRMFPGLDKKIKGPKPILDNAQIQVSIVADDFMDGESTGEYTIFNWESPTEKKFIKQYNKEIPYFTEPDLPYYEHTTVFEAEVPYTVEKWEKSQLLYTDSTEQLEELTKEVVAAYMEMKDIFQKKNKKHLAAISYNKEKRIAQQMYYTQQKSKERWDDYIESFNSEEVIDYAMLPIENFRLVFYGNGRLVGLERIDLKYRGESALICTYKNKKGEKRKSHFDFILHRPKRGGKLEPI